MTTTITKTTTSTVIPVTEIPETELPEAEKSVTPSSSVVFSGLIRVIYAYIFHGIEMNGYIFGGNNTEDAVTKINLKPNEKITHIRYNTIKKGFYGSPNPYCNFEIITTLTNYGPFGTTSFATTHCKHSGTYKKFVSNHDFFKFLQNKAKVNSEGYIYFTD